jgi:hypothetical protein
MSGSDAFRVSMRRFCGVFKKPRMSMNYKLYFAIHARDLAMPSWRFSCGSGGRGQEGV